MKTSQERPWKKEKGLSISLVFYMVFPFLLFGQKAWNIHLAQGIEDYTASSNHELPQLAVVGLNDNVCESPRHKKNINQLPLESSDGKESTCNAGDPASIPGLGRSPGGEHGNPLQCSCPENLLDRGAWQATVNGVTKSWTLLKQLSSSSLHLSP